MVRMRRIRSAQQRCQWDMRRKQPVQVMLVSIRVDMDHMPLFRFQRLPCRLDIRHTLFVRWLVGIVRARMVHMMTDHLRFGQFRLDIYHR
jgi:hypothetical protein